MRQPSSRGQTRPWRRREPHRPPAPFVHIPHPNCWAALLLMTCIGLWLVPGRALAQATNDEQSSVSHGGLTCTPDVPEVQTRRPIPFDCRADDEAVRVSVRYREHADAPWRTLELEKTGSSFRATLPCEVTMTSGRLSYFIVATDGAGDPMDTLGSKNTPRELVLNPRSTVTPAYPGEEPPARCEEQVECPPDFPGCDDPEALARSQYRTPVKLPEQWVGIHFAADVGFLGGSNVCTANNPDYDCFTSGSDTPFPGALAEGVARLPGELGDGYPGTDIDSSLAVGTLRLLLAYDRALNDRISVGGRLGYAFRGGPTSLDGDSFLPIHVEAHLAYWPSGQWQPGVRPYLQLGAGLAEVDLKKADVPVRDCTEQTGRQLFLDCIAAANDFAPEANPDLPVRSLDAYRKLGNTFVSVGGGVSIPLGDRTAIQANLNAMLMLPSVGVVLQPSLGLVYGL